MGLFRREKKIEEEISGDETLRVQVKSSNEIQNEQFENELNYLKKEIQSKTESLNSISQKLESVKTEYDTAVSNLMSTKKELAIKKETRDSIEKNYTESLSEHDSIKSKIALLEKNYEEKKNKIDEIETANTNYDKLQSDLEKSQNQYHKIEAMIQEAKKKLSKVVEEKTKNEAELSQTISKLDRAQKELQNLPNKVTAKVNASGAKEKHLSFGVGDEQKNANKNVIEAASAVVSSLNSKLQAAQKELEVVKRLLEKERKKHQQ